MGLRQKLENHPTACTGKFLPVLGLVLVSCATPRSESGDVVRFGVSLGLNSLTLDTDGSRTFSATKEPDAKSYPDNPTSGSFRAYSLLSLRAVETLFLNLSGARDFFVGVGLDSLASGDSSGLLQKKDGASLGLQSWSALVESGLRRRLAGGNSIELGGALTWGLSGKAVYHYKAADEMGAIRDTVLEEKQTSSVRTFLFGRYHFTIWDSLQAGVQLEGYYGSMAFEPNPRKAKVQGSALLALLQLGID